MKLPRPVHAGALVLAAAALAVAAGPASAHGGPPPGGSVFVQTDDPAGNAVVAYDRDRDGALRQAGTYATGGLGGVLAGSVVDHLASQGSLTADPAHGLLYAVNAGSNSITVFGVAGDRLVRRQVLSSGGAFPVSVAVHGNLVYVLNARDGGSVQGFLRVGRLLLRVPGWHRALGLDASLTPEFTHTPGQVAFTPDGGALLVTTKANGNAVDVFRVRRLGGLSRAPESTVLPGAVPFAIAFDAGGHLAIAEAGPNAVATFALDRGGALTPVDAALTGQAATCWITSVGTRLYASNAGGASVSGFDDPGTGALTALGVTTTHPGTVDAAASPDGRTLYVQTGAAGIVDAFRVGADGSLSAIGSVTVPGAVGGEGIAVG